MRIEINHSCSGSKSYWAARVKSLFNVEDGADFSLRADLPIDDDGWSLGLIVGPSGSGKTSMGKRIFGEGAFLDPEAWPADAAIIDALAPFGEFDAVTASFSRVGLGSVPAWLRPFRVLSNGEKFRANLARVLCRMPAKVVVDEFTSVVDRQVAKVGACAFGRSWKEEARRIGAKCVLLSCHYDIIEWLRPDWVFDLATGKFHRGRLRPRPEIGLEIWDTDWRYWPLFVPHHYLKLPPMVCSRCYVGAVDGKPVAHIGMTTAIKGRDLEARAARFVVMPQWQGIGVGMKFLNAVCEMQLGGTGRIRGRSLTTFISTSHPGLVRALRRDERWRQISCALHGADKRKTLRNLSSRGRKPKAGFGGHFRAVQGFRYYGNRHE